MRRDDALTFGEVLISVGAFVLGFLLAATLSLLGQGCVTLPPTITVMDERVPWEGQPLVGTDDRSLEDDTRSAVQQWGWGLFQRTCYHAQICVRRGPLEPGGPWGRAVWQDGRLECTVLIMVQTWAVVAHEIGHCYGLDHSTDRRSVMYEYVQSPLDAHSMGQWITRADREALSYITASAGDD